MILAPSFLRFSIIGMTALWLVGGSPVPAIMTDQHYEGGPMFVFLWPGVFRQIEEGGFMDPEMIGQRDLANDSDYDYDSGE